MADDAVFLLSLFSLLAHYNKMQLHYAILSMFYYYLLGSVARGNAINPGFVQSHFVFTIRRQQCSHYFREGLRYLHYRMPISDSNTSFGLDGLY